MEGDVCAKSSALRSSPPCISIIITNQKYHVENTENRKRLRSCDNVNITYRNRIWFIAKTTKDFQNRRANRTELTLNLLEVNTQQHKIMTATDSRSGENYRYPTNSPAEFQAMGAGRAHSLLLINNPLQFPASRIDPDRHLSHQARTCFDKGHPSISRGGPE